MGERWAYLEPSLRAGPDVHAPIGNYAPLLCRLSRQRQKSDEPAAVGGTIRPARRQAESTVGVDHDDHLRLAARASAPGHGRRSFAPTGVGNCFYQ